MLTAATILCLAALLPAHPQAEATAGPKGPTRGSTIEVTGHGTRTPVAVPHNPRASDSFGKTLGSSRTLCAAERSEAAQ